MAAHDTRPPTNVRNWTIAVSDLDAVLDQPMKLRYVHEIDSLFMYFADPFRPYVGVVIGDNHTALIDPETNMLIGFEVDHFKSEVVVETPELKSLLSNPEISRNPFHRVRIRPDRSPSGEAEESLLGALAKQMIRSVSSTESTLLVAR